MIALLLTLAGAHAASLDLLEVGGHWGTPAATNPSAVWWNPAGLAAGKGTQFLIEGAPTFAKISFDRTDPGYGGPESDEWSYGGRDDIGFKGTVPFFGVSSDFGIDNLGVGLGVGAPIARGGHQEVDGGPGRFHLRDGNIQAVYLMAGAGWTFFDKLSIGLSGAFVDSTWSARTDVETLTSLRDAVSDRGFANLYCEDDDAGPCDDYLLEHPDYAATLTFDPLKARKLTFGAGIYAQPIEQVGISVAYHHGMRLDHTGTMGLEFGCPPDGDPLGKFAAEFGGLCNTDVRGDGSIGYRLPSRINVGVVLQPVERLRIEAMGGWVGWKAFTDYDIETRVSQDQFEDAICGDDGCNDSEAERAHETSTLVSQNRQWARDNRNTFWVGADGKVELNRFLMVGGRVIFDRSAIPNSALSTNNYDADTVNLGGLVFFSPLEQLGIGLSLGHQFLASRTVTDSAYAITMARNDQKADRYFYPTANGTYSGSITRVGVSIRGRFLAKGQQ